MSAANLYRHFKNKMDIVAQLAIQCMDQGQQLALEIVNDEQRSAAVRLREYAHCQLKHHYDEYMQRPKLNELVDIVCQQHQYLVEEKIRAEVEMLTRLIHQGIAQDELYSVNVAGDAEALHSALGLVSTPFFIPIFSIEELERRTDHLITLLLQGLRKR